MEKDEKGDIIKPSDQASLHLLTAQGTSMGPWVRGPMRLYPYIYKNGTTPMISLFVCVDHRAHAHLPTDTSTTQRTNQ